MKSFEVYSRKSLYCLKKKENNLLIGIQSEARYAIHIFNPTIGKAEVGES